MQDDAGCSPLLIACQQGHLAVVHALLHAGAQHDLADTYAATPLFIASQVLGGPHGGYVPLEPWTLALAP